MTMGLVTFKDYNISNREARKREGNTILNLENIARTELYNR